MNHGTRRAASYAGVLVVAVGIAFAASSPASAAAPNQGVALQASGLLPLNPLIVSSFPGTSPNHSVLVDLPPLLTAGVADSSAGPTSATATVSNLGLTLSSLVSLGASSLTSSCIYNAATDTVSATSDVENGGVVLFGAPIALNPHPAPNTTLNLPGIATVTLNRQTTAPDGALTTDALAITLLGGVENVAIATTTCNRATLS
jgi:hypothetical protein